MEIDINRFIQEARTLGSCVDDKYAIFHPVLLLRNDRRISLLLDEIMRQQHTTEISREIDGANKTKVREDMGRCIQYLEMKHRINSNKFLIISATLSVSISAASLILGFVSLCQ